MKTSHDILINAAQNASFNTAAFRLDNMLRVSFQSVWTGTNGLGSIKLQGSNDLADGNASSTGGVPATWIDLVGTGFTDSTRAVDCTDSSKIKFLHDYPCGFKWIRMVYTHTSGSFTNVLIKVFAKGV